MRQRRSVAAVAVLSLLAAACGSDDSGDAAEAEPAPAEAPEPEPAASAEPDEPNTSDADADDTAESADAAESADGASDTSASVVIEHKFGETVIEGTPERVVSIGYNEHDFVLALGVEPVAVRDWYGDYEYAVWPWAQDELGDATPEKLSGDALNFEQIASLDPDVIVGVWSGMTEQDYELLSAIAPTVAQPDAYADYGTPWQEQTEILGVALGREAEADAAVAAVEDRFAEVRAAHPEWEGLTAGVAFLFEDGLGVYATQDTRSRFMADLGFTIPDRFDAGGEFFLDVSPEDLSPLDVDVLVWVAGTQEGLDAILTEVPTRSSLRAVEEGREIFASVEVGGAFSHSSPLSLDFVIDALVPEIEAAIDGDPSTPVPSAVELGAVAADGGAAEAPDGSEDEAAAPDDPAAAAAAAWSIVFDSSADLDAKRVHLEGADDLAGTVEAYTAAGEGFGGISLAPTSVEVEGDTATITYDVNFGENPAYSDQSGTISFVDGTWVVSRDEFCSFMASARVNCSG